jgi:hypothetical protein
MNQLENQKLKLEKLLQHVFLKRQNSKEQFLIRPTAKFQLKQNDLGYFNEMQKNSTMQTLLKKQVGKYELEKQQQYLLALSRQSMQLSNKPLPIEIDN